MNSIERHRFRNKFSTFKWKTHILHIKFSDLFVHISISSWCGTSFSKNKEIESWTIFVLYFNNFTFVWMCVNSPILTFTILIVLVDWTIILAIYGTIRTQAFITSKGRCKIDCVDQTTMLKKNHYKLNPKKSSTKTRMQN